MALGQHTCCCVQELWESSTWHQVLEDQLLGEAILPQNRRYAYGFIGKQLLEQFVPRCLTLICAKLHIQIQKLKAKDKLLKVYIRMKSWGI